MAIGDIDLIDLCSGISNADTLPDIDVEDPDISEEREISFGAGVELESGKRYAIICRVVNQADDTHKAVAWDRNTATGFVGYMGDNYHIESGEISDDISQYPDLGDFWFRTKAEEVVKDGQTDGSIDDYWEFYYSPAGGGTDLWLWQSFTASSTYTITSVILRLARISTPGNIQVSIQTIIALPEKAITPTPSDVNTDVHLDQATITWVDGGNADTFDVYYGTTSGALGDVISSAQAGTSLTVTGITDGSPYAYLSTRYWRIDSTNDFGTTVGDEWSFTTVRLKPPGPTYQYNDFYYQLLVDEDGNWGTPPPVGVEGIDYVVVTYGPNFIRTVRKLVVAGNNEIYIEDLV